MAVQGNFLTPATMQEGTATIRRAQDGIRTNVAQLDQIFEEIGQNWRDENGQTYVRKSGEAKEAVKEYLDSCERLANLLEAVLKAYQENVYDPTRKAVNTTEEA